MSGDLEGACFRSLSSHSHAGASVSVGRPGSRLESAFRPLSPGEERQVREGVAEDAFSCKQQRFVYSQNKKSRDGQSLLLVQGINEALANISTCFLTKDGCCKSSHRIHEEE